MKVKCSMCGRTSVVKIDGRKVFDGQGEFTSTCQHCSRPIYVVVSIS